MWRTVVISLLVSCTTAGKLNAGLGIVYVGAGTAMIATDAESHGGIALLGVGATLLAAALIVELADVSEATSSFASGGTATITSSEIPTPSRHAPQPISGASDSQCSFGNCATNGSTGRTASGETINTQCSFGDCTKQGWTTTTSAGTETTQCSFGDCTTQGWRTSTPTGSAETQCSFGDCTTQGWRTSTSDGTSSETRCKFGDCATQGWTTTSSDGQTLDCTCKFGDCNAHGTECR